MMRALTAADGHVFDCYMLPAEGERRGGLVIVQEIFGVTDQLKSVAARYAALGCDVAVPALFDRKERETVIPFDQHGRGRDLMLSCDLDENMTDIAAAVSALAESGGKVAVMGFCWGGGLALRAAQLLPIAGAVVFYGTRLPVYLDRPLKAPVQGHFGKADTTVPQEMLDKTIAYLPDMEVHMYDAGHAFANDARPNVYNREAAETAHARAQEFVAKVLA